MPRGGRRQGQPGASYSNRTDLNAHHAPAGTVGAPTPQANPLVGQASPAAPAGPQNPLSPAQPPPAPLPAPGSLPGFGAPTARPLEPLTHGLPSGPGAGPEVLQQFTPDPMAQAAAQLGSIPAVHQTPMLRAILAATRASVDNASNPNIAQGPPQ